MNLFVDDRRPMPKTGYQCCRDVEGAKFLLSFMTFETVSLDYNLGDGGCGMEILEYMFEHNIQVARINIHSDNLLGIEEMKAYCAEHFPHVELTLRRA